MKSQFGGLTFKVIFFSTQALCELNLFAGDMMFSRQKWDEESWDRQEDRQKNRHFARFNCGIFFLI